MLIAAGAIFSFLVTAIGVGVLRSWLLKKDYLDHPNERSSHKTPTPRGGGLVIFGVCIALYAAGGLFGVFEPNWFYVTAATLIAAISWADDVMTLPSMVRLAVHFAAAVIVVFGTSGFSQVAVPFVGIVELGSVGIALSVIWIVWMTNAYNFMDGIDGIAGSQGIVAGVGWCVYAIFSRHNDIAFYAAAVAASCAGFLIHNWSPARIFMGDVGSAFLGFTFAAVPLLIASKEPQRTALLPWLAAAFVWFFFFDTAVTFFKRLMAGEKVWTPHRSHIYQKMVIAGRSHSFVSKIYALFSSLIVFAAIAAIFLTPSSAIAVPIAIAAATIGLLIVYRFNKG